MAKRRSARRTPSQPRAAAAAQQVSSSIEEMLLAALERSDGGLETGRYLITYREDAVKQGVQSLKAQGIPHGRCTRF